MTIPSSYSLTVPVIHFQVTVTKPRCPPATSAALRAVGRFWELTPPRLRRAGIPVHLAEGQGNAREQQVRGALNSALNGFTPSASQQATARTRAASHA